MKKPITIWDLDNCLSNDEWRIKFIDWRSDEPWSRYRMYHTLCGSDPAANQDEFRRWLKLGAWPVFCTGRPEIARAITQVWINSNFGIDMADHDVRTISLYMRGNTDHRPSELLKQDLVNHILADFSIDATQVLSAFDDHEGVIEAYRLHFGFQAKLLKVHSTSYERPQQ